MTDPRRIPDDILCLAHTDHNREWCEKYRTCQRHVSIVIGDFSADTAVMTRACKPGKQDRYIEASS
jgi:hypothetical protein